MLIVKSGRIQSAVESYREPKRTGPAAAIKEPTDCAIPDSREASCASFARNEKNIIDKLNAEPQAAPIHMTAIVISTECPLISPPVAKITNIPVKALNIFWSVIFSAIIGTINVNGIKANCISDSNQPAVSDE